jgi:hypothetical protein
MSWWSLGARQARRPPPHNDSGEARNGPAATRRGTYIKGDGSKAQRQRLIADQVPAPKRSPGNQVHTLLSDVSVANLLGLQITETSPRLGRNTADLAGIVKALADRHVGLRSLTETWLDTTTSQGVLMFHFFSAIAENERNRYRERTLAGLAAAKARGRVGGRPTKMTAEKAATAHRMRSEKRTIRDIAKTIDIGEATVVRELAGQRRSLQVPNETGCGC